LTPEVRLSHVRQRNPAGPIDTVAPAVLLFSQPDVMIRHRIVAQKIDPKSIGLEKVRQCHRQRIGEKFVTALSKPERSFTV
jgi:hypothetical protein